MADLRPPNPRQLLEDAATATGSFADVRPDTFPGEIPRAEFPTWALDPREEEQPHKSRSTSSKHYGVDVEFVCYLAVESGPERSDRADARSELKSLRNEYLTQLFEDTSKIEKTGRTMSDVTQGETTVLMDAISLQVNQTQIYG